MNLYHSIIWSYFWIFFVESYLSELGSQEKDDLNVSYSKNEYSLTEHDELPSFDDILTNQSTVNITSFDTVNFKYNNSSDAYSYNDSSINNDKFEITDEIKKTDQKIKDQLEISEIYKYIYTHENDTKLNNNEKWENAEELDEFLKKFNQIFNPNSKIILKDNQSNYIKDLTMDAKNVSQHLFYHKNITESNDILELSENSSTNNLNSYKLSRKYQDPAFNVTTDDKSFNDNDIISETDCNRTKTIEYPESDNKQTFIDIVDLPLLNPSKLAVLNILPGVCLCVIASILLSLYCTIKKRKSYYYRVKNYTQPRFEPLSIYGCT